jgi:hypothetical protein
MEAERMNDQIPPGPRQQRIAHRAEIAALAHQVVDPAPMSFIGDPTNGLVLAELIIRQFEEKGWTPPSG